jgi:hypothetical protein
MGNPDEWLETVRKCEYLPEQDIKKLCEMVTPCSYKTNLEWIHASSCTGPVYMIIEFGC